MPPIRRPRTEPIPISSATLTDEDMANILDTPLPVPKNPMKEEKKAPEKPRLHLKDILSTQLLGLLRLAPDNELVRGLVLRATQKLPPKEVQGYSAVKEWLEENCEDTIKTNPHCPVQCLPFKNRITVEYKGTAEVVVQRDYNLNGAISEDVLVSWIREYNQAIDQGTARGIEHFLTKQMREHITANPFPAPRVQEAIATRVTLKNGVMAEQEPSTVVTENFGGSNVVNAFCDILSRRFPDMYNKFCEHF